jgi:hypothetical protein
MDVCLTGEVCCGGVGESEIGSELEGIAVVAWRGVEGLAFCKYSLTFLSRLFRNQWRRRTPAMVRILIIIFITITTPTIIIFVGYWNIPDSDYYILGFPRQFGQNTNLAAFPSVKVELFRVVF